MTRTIIIPTLLGLSLTLNAYHYLVTSNPEAQKKISKPKNKTEAPAKLTETKDREKQQLEQKLAKLRKEINEAQLVKEELKQQENNKVNELVEDIEQIDSEFQERLNSIEPESAEYKLLSNVLKSFAKSDKLVSDFFQNIDISQLSDQDKTAFNNFLKRMKKVDELKLKTNDSTNLADQLKIRQQIMREQITGSGEMIVARKAAMHSLAKSLGYKNKDISQFTDYIDFIYKNTSPGSFFEDIISNDNGGGAVMIAPQIDIIEK